MNYLKTILLIAVCLLFLCANSAQALISPEHYERIMKGRQKAKDSQKKDSQTPMGQDPRLKKGRSAAPD